MASFRNRGIAMTSFRLMTSLIMIWWTCEWGRYLGFLIGQNLIDPNQLKSVFLHFGIGDDVSDPKYSKLVLDQDQHKLNQSNTRNFHQWIEHVMSLIALVQILHNEYSNRQEYLNLKVKRRSKWGQIGSKRVNKGSNWGQTLTTMASEPRLALEFIKTGYLIKLFNIWKFLKCRI